MLNFLKKIMLFLFPIVSKAVLQTAADALTDVAYSGGRTARRKSYDQPPRGYTDMVDYAVADAEATQAMYEGREPFHDVLMVAMDLRSYTREDAEEFIHSIMPRVRHLPNGVILDSYWIADDDSDGDCDSAVFVSKGNQDAARGLLREYDLVR